MTLDPGETTGYAVFTDRGQIQLTAAGQIKTWPFAEACDNLTELLDKHRPQFVVYESYHVYDWKLDQHSFSQVPTIQVIGCIRTLCHQFQVPTKEQTALVGKSFCDDDKLKQWGFYLEGLRHARDAIRHGCQFLIFHGRPEK